MIFFPPFNFFFFRLSFLNFKISCNLNYLIPASYRSVGNARLKVRTFRFLKNTYRLINRERFFVQSLAYKYAATRCAAYQESGYPAGRWRLPTKAEIMFMIQLSAKNKIPQLFTPGAISTGGYWCSSGVVFPVSNTNIQYYDINSTQVRNNNGGNHYTRCVYDTWYWGADPDSSHLTTWGGYQTN